GLLFELFKERFPTESVWALLEGLLAIAAMVGEEIHEVLLEQNQTTTTRTGEPPAPPEELPEEERDEWEEFDQALPVDDEPVQPGPVGPVAVAPSGPADPVETRPELTAVEPDSIPFSNEPSPIRVHGAHLLSVENLFLKADSGDIWSAFEEATLDFHAVLEDLIAFAESDQGQYEWIIEWLARDVIEPLGSILIGWGSVGSLESFLQSQRQIFDMLGGILQTLEDIALELGESNPQLVETLDGYYTTFEGISDTLTKVFLFSGGLGFEQELEFEPVGDSELLAYVPAGTPPGKYSLFAVGKGGQSNPLSLRVSGTVVAGSVLDPFAGLQLAVEPGSLKGKTLLDLRD